MTNLLLCITCCSWERVKGKTSFLVTCTRIGKKTGIIQQLSDLVGFVTHMAEHTCTEKFSVIENNALNFSFVINIFNYIGLQKLERRRLRQRWKLQSLHGRRTRRLSSLQIRLTICHMWWFHSFERHTVIIKRIDCL